MVPFYQVKGAFIRQVGNEDNLVVIDEVFKDDNPMVARRKAYDFYQNYIELLLESKNKHYISHKETVKELQDFFNSYQQAAGIEDLEIDMDFDKGLAIYLIESPETYTTLEGEVIFVNKKIIHYIDKEQVIKYKDLIMANRKYESRLRELRKLKARGEVK